MTSGTGAPLSWMNKKLWCC